MSDNQSVIRVMIVDDHSMVRQGLKDFLDSFTDFELIGEASNGLEAVSLSKQITPDVILMDLIMPEMDGINATRQITKDQPAVKIIALTTFQDEELIQSVLEAGAISYLQKNINIQELGNVIRKAFDDIPTLSPEATRSLINTAIHKPKFVTSLTPRERQVLALMVASHSNPEIATQLNLSLSNVKTHVTNILSKFEVKKRVEAVKIAIKYNLVE